MIFDTQFCQSIHPKVFSDTPKRGTTYLRVPDNRYDTKKGLRTYEIENTFLTLRSQGATYNFESFSTNTFFDCAGHNGQS